MSTPPQITGARGTGPLQQILKPDYSAFTRKRKVKRPRKRRVPPTRPPQMRGGY